jgi:hypothetical protein
MDFDIHYNIHNMFIYTSGGLILDIGWYFINFLHAYD